MGCFLGCFFNKRYVHTLDFPGGASGKELTCQRRRHKRQVQSLGGKDPLEECVADHSNIFPWRIPWTEEPGELQSIASQIRVRHNWSNLARTYVHTVLVLYKWLKQQKIKATVEPII